MTIASSIFLIAVGAILYFAINLHVAHLNVDTVGEDRRDPREPPPR